jgi:hypothetical protein
VENYQPEFNSTVKCGEDVIKEPSVEPAMKEKFEDELSTLKERWLGINKNLDTLMSRYVTTNHLHPIASQNAESVMQSEQQFG